MTLPSLSVTLSLAPSSSFLVVISCLDTSTFVSSSTIDKDVSLPSSAVNVCVLKVAYPLGVFVSFNTYSSPASRP